MKVNSLFVLAELNLNMGEKPRENVILINTCKTGNT